MTDGHADGELSFEEMCLGVYESFVNLNPFHVDHFLHTADLEGAAWWRPILGRCSEDFRRI